jgi:malate dehydrogenase
MSISQTKLTVVGAGYVGSTCAQLAASKDLAGEICLIDVVEGRPQGIALDLNQMAAVEGFSSRVTGTNDAGDTAGSDVVIMTAGKPRTPGMSRSDLLVTNGRVICAVADYVRETSPDAIVIVVTNPLDSMVHLMRARTGFTARRVVGMAGVLDSARLRYFAAEATGTAARDAEAMVLGAHGDSMVPVAEHMSVAGVALDSILDAHKIDALSDRTRHGGAEIVGLLKTGSAWYAPAAAAVAMASSVLRDEQRLMPAACLLNGQYGLEGLYMGVPAVLGAGGVESIVELPLAAESRIQMQKTAGAISADLETLREAGLL